MGKYDALAKDIIQNVGGKENVSSLTHCVTRLRFQLKDESKANTEVLKNMDGVVTVIQTAGQYQVVIGNHVPDVYKDVCAIGGFGESTGGETKKDMKFSEKALDLISGIFMPSMSILCASGILKGVNSILDMAGIIPAASGLGLMLAGAADAMFLFFPIIIGYNAFKKLGGNPFLGLTLGAAMVYPTLQNVDIDVFGLVVNTTYESTMLPIVILSFLAVPVEKWLNKVIPDVVKTFVTPAIVLAIFLPVGFTIIGPAANWLGEMISIALNGVYGFSPILAAALFGFLWQLLVMIGCHVAVVLPLMVALMAGQPQPLMVAISFPSFVQTGAVIAIWMKTKNKKLKEVAFPAWISGIFGVTEPAIYGVTLPNGKQFILTWVGAGLIGGLGVLLGCNMYTMGGMGVFALPALINPANPGGSLINAVIMMIAAMAVGFAGAFVTYKEAKEPAKADAAPPPAKAAREVISAPVNGKFVALNQVADAAFAQGALGKGAAIEPSEGKITSPVTGTVMTLFPTKHAIGIVSDNGAEVLIHIGMDTVNLNGKYFEAHVKQGDHVKKGDLLVTFDIDKIKAEGYSVVTPVIITNTNDYTDVIEMEEPEIEEGDDLITALV